jgi:membrane protein implicated in regulation of membrane protease activity
MTPVFVVCAAVGTTVLVLQFLLALVGLGGDALGVDVPHDFGHDLGGVDHDLAPGEVHGDVAHDGSAVEHVEAHGQLQHSAPAHAAHGSTWLFQVLSLRTIVAALAFFGLSGLAAGSAGFPPATTLLIAAAAGLGAMYAVYAMLRSMRSLRAEGTVRIHRAVGQQATVYLHIPAQQKGAGKIQINLQNRTMEYLATTLGDAIPSGATVVVTKIVGSDTVQVQAVANHNVA